MKEAVSLLIEDLESFADVCKEKALETKSILTIGRTHGIHAEPTSFGLKFALWYSITKQNIHRLRLIQDEICQAKLSGAVGNYTNSNPSIEAFALQDLGLMPAPFGILLQNRTFIGSV